MSYYGYYDGHPSSKQMRYIKAIELYVDEEFTGDTMEEASEYIRRHERAYKEGRKKVDIKTKLAEKQQEEELLKKLLQDSTSQDPVTLYPKARSITRRFILHVGPTNSGKTYSALEALKTAYNGVYLGPLRLLALEVSEKFNNQGIPCSLITGEEEQIVENAYITASTIEMLSVKEHYDIVVIDEAQMLQDRDRGHNWTNAIIGSYADEIHVCMAPEALDIVVALINACNDTYEIVEHTRKTPLEFESKTDKNKNPGDAYIVFSRKEVLALASDLESKGNKVSVIYGSLPPAARREEARRFIEGETNILVSTDAIGMGLNLPIKRVVFMKTTKFDGKEQRMLTESEIKQIAGRAGRQGIFDIGYVYSKEHQGYVQKALMCDIPSIKQASFGIPEPAFMLPYNIKKILSRWNQIDVPDLYVKMDVEPLIELCNVAPIDVNECPRDMLYQFLTCSIDTKNTTLIEDWRLYFFNIFNNKDIVMPKVSKSNSLEELETNYKQFDLYFQVCKKFRIPVDAIEINDIKSSIAKRINNILKKDKEKYKKSCRICGKSLPFNHQHGICEKCYRKNYDWY
jgi:ATP-dependent RNA helicase SUPV3L1/SUV3